MTLEILICTIDEGIEQVAQMVLEQHKDISYLVSWQHSTDKEIALPKELKRNDVKIYDLSGRGLSRNRNNCLRHATADLCLIADDDCRHSHHQLQAVIDTFAQNPNVDIATFRYSSASDQKQYPSICHNLSNFPKGYYVTSMEIAFRRKSVQGKVWFNEHFGLGAEIFHCGEEHIFIQDAISKELTCMFFPITIVKAVCKNRNNEPGTLMAHGAIIQLYHPKTSNLRIFLKAFRMWRKKEVSFFKAIKHMKNGSKYIKLHPEIM